MGKSNACFVPDAQGPAPLWLAGYPMPYNVTKEGKVIHCQMISFTKSTFYSPNISLRIWENFFIECVRQNSRGVASEGLNPNENWFCWDMAHITWHALSQSSALQRLHNSQYEFMYFILDSIQLGSLIQINQPTVWLLHAVCKPGTPSLICYFAKSPTKSLAFSLVLIW
jgi:hypothetical protein